MTILWEIFAVHLDASSLMFTSGVFRWVIRASNSIKHTHYCFSEESKLRISNSARFWVFWPRNVVWDYTGLIFFQFNQWKFILPLLRPPPIAYLMSLKLFREFIFFLSHGLVLFTYFHTWVECDTWWESCLIFYWFVFIVFAYVSLNNISYVWVITLGWFASNINFHV